MGGLITARLALVSLCFALFLCVGTHCADELNSEIGNHTMIIVGGISEVPVDSPEITRLAKIVTDKLSEGDNKERKVVQILKAGLQVVSGTLTHLTLKITDGEEVRTYEASIWEQPWLNKTEITKLKSLDDDDQDN